ncbi:hypothetical protein FACS1894184_12780 [Clostridia bacterium]|nr:hypothetical protein FACS1894184_12780 [Clostridia bacterium]
MSQILKLREQRAASWDKAKSFLDSCRDENGLVSAENAATYDRMEAEIVAMGKDIDRLERQASIDAELNAPTSAPIVNTPSPVRSALDGKPGRASAEYKTAFWNVIREQTPRHDVYNSLKLGVDSEGGYLCPDSYEQTLLEALREENMFRRLAHVIRTASGERKIPVVATKGEAAWVEEAGEIPESDDSFAMITLGAHKVATMLRISEELLNDSLFDLEAYVAKEFSRRIGQKEEAAFFTGNGINKPTGILADAGGAQLGSETAPNKDIVLDDIVDLFYSLSAPYRSKSVFITNDATIKTLRKLKDSAGNFLWAPSIKESTPDTLMNRPIYTSSFMPTSGTAGAKIVLFGDLSYYWIADRQGRSFKRLNELYAKSDQIGFKATQRVDGKLALPEAVKFLKYTGAGAGA